MFACDGGLALAGRILIFSLLGLSACQGDKVITPVPSNPAKTGPLQSVSPSAPLQTP